MLQTEWEPARFPDNRRVFSLPAAVQGSLSDINSGANADAVLTYAAAPNVAHLVSHVAWSYSAAPTAGRLTISDGASVVFDIDITAAVAGSLSFPQPKRNANKNTALEVRLYAGGNGVTGKVNAMHWTEPF